MERFNLVKKNIDDMQSFATARGRVYLSKVVSEVGSVRSVTGFSVSICMEDYTEEYFSKTYTDAKTYYNEIIKQVSLSEKGILYRDNITGETELDYCPISSSLKRSLGKAKIKTVSDLITARNEGIENNHGIGALGKKEVDIFIRMYSDCIKV